MESILETIKKLLGPDSSYEVFDEDIIIHINTALADLTQLGVGPEMVSRSLMPVQHGMTSSVSMFIRRRCLASRPMSTFR